jgi:hypothetical protein
MNGVPEEWVIFYKAHSFLNKLGYSSDIKDLEKVLFKLNLDDLYMNL